MTSSDTNEVARALLRERQGAGARYDAAGAPKDDLLLARRGTAFFARQLGSLTDAELDGPSVSLGKTRRHIVVDVAFQARALARLVAAARQGLEVETIVEPDLFLEDVDLAVTLPAHALRYLFQHSEVHLNVEWRDLSGDGWTKTVRSLDGRAVRIDTTPALRAQKIWAASVAMDPRGRWTDVPDVIHRATDFGELA